MFQVWTMKDGQIVWEGWLFIMVFKKFKQPITLKAYIVQTMYIMYLNIVTFSRTRKFKSNRLIKVS